MSNFGVETGGNSESDGGGIIEGECADSFEVEVKEVDNFETLSPKKLRNDDARSVAEEYVGRVDSEDRLRNELRTGHNFLGFFVF